MYTSAPISFNASVLGFEESDYAVFGVPYDRSSTYEANSRWSPIFTRIASMNIETYSMRTGIDLEKVALSDIGDLQVDDDIRTNLIRIEDVVSEIASAGKTPVMLGGEHIITLGAVRALKEGVGVVDFDAHLDLRSSYLGNRFSHACVMRRIVEEIGPDRLLVLGARAISSEEVAFARKNRIKFVSSQEFRKRPLGEIVKSVKDFISSFTDIYVTIDSDVFDPAYAPNVGNPEPEGLAPTDVFEIFPTLAQKGIKGMDEVEATASPHHGSGPAIELAARTIFELVAHIEKNKA